MNPGQPRSEKVACSFHLLECHFFHPAVLNGWAYIRPMAPIPINPIVGWHSKGEDGVTDGEMLMGDPPSWTLVEEDIFREEFLSEIWGDNISVESWSFSCLDVQWTFNMKFCWKISATLLEFYRRLPSHTATHSRGPRRMFWSKSRLVSAKLSHVSLGYYPSLN